MKAQTQKKRKLEPNAGPKQYLRLSLLSQPDAPKQTKLIEPEKINSDRFEASLVNEAGQSSFKFLLSWQKPAYFDLQLLNSENRHAIQIKKGSQQVLIADELNFDEQGTSRVEVTLSDLNNQQKGLTV